MNTEKDNIQVLTQSGVIQHLLDVAQHTATREELAKTDDRIADLSKSVVTREELKEVADETNKKHHPKTNVLHKNVHISNFSLWSQE